MTPQTTELTIGALPVRAFTSYTPCAKVFVQSKEGATGNIYVGGSNVSAAGANAIASIPPGSGTTPGGSFTIESQNDHNLLDASSYYIHGSNAGDKVRFTIHQA